MRSSIYDRSTLVAIAIGGVLGASLRWLITRPGSPIDGGWFAYAPNSGVTLGTDVTGFEPVDAALRAGTGFPASTLTVNLLGCLLLGALTAALSRVRGRVPVICGSLTTFSTFAADVAIMLRAHPLGRDYGGAGGYLALSLVGGALAFWMGRTMIRLVST